MRGTYATVDLGVLEQNIRAVRAKIGAGRQICLPVKANAYGHGAVETAQAALGAGVSHLGVATVAEGAALREAGISAPVLVFSPVFEEELPEAIENGLIIFAGEKGQILAAERAAARAKKTLEVHLKVDTGMGRVGAAPQDAPGLAQLIAASPSLRLGGLATHLACSDSLAAEDISYTTGQLAAFRQCSAAIREKGIAPGILHAANSGGVVQYEESFFDMVRPGILLYGYNPLPACGPKTRPVMALRSRIAFIKRAEKGASISYGRTWSAPGATCIATLPIGYADGLARALSGTLSFWAKGRSYPQVGRICMDQCMVDLGPDPDLAIGDELTVYGGEAPGADAIAEKLGTIPYEVLCAVSARVPRVYRR
jgi:alanine racemase